MLLRREDSLQLHHRPKEHKSTSVTQFLCTNLQKCFKEIEHTKKTKQIPSIKGSYYISPTGASAPVKLCSVWWLLIPKVQEKCEEVNGIPA